MTETDTYLVSRIRDEVFEQNNKLDKIAEQLEAQTKLQAGIFKQLYLLCQIAATPSNIIKASFGGESEEVFMITPIPRKKSNENLKAEKEILNPGSTT